MSSPPQPADNPSPQPRHDPYVALRNSNFRQYFIGNAFSLFGMQMMAVAIGWELYALTNSAVALGLVGLVQVVPIIALALPAGHTVDRVNRKLLILGLTAMLVMISLTMGFSSLHSHTEASGTFLVGANGLLARIAGLFGETSGKFSSAHIPVMFLLLLCSGVVRSFNQPAKQSLMPMLVPAEQFPNAVTWNSSLFEITNVVGPTVAGGIIYFFLARDADSHWAYAAIYFANAFGQFMQLLNFTTIKLAPRTASREPLTLSSLFAGVRFVYADKIILGVITLDMFAVLLGGATALLPVFAKDILHVGPAGLGLLRAAPSGGAVLMALVLAHSPPMKHAGRNLMLCVTGFGLATIVFGMSPYFWLSVAALFLTGVFDNVSVVVRHTLVQLRTPDAMRGRVNAVNSVFISSSNELGAFESGITAAIGRAIFGLVLGPMIAVALGGVGTIAVVAGIAALWPQLPRVGKLTQNEPEAIEEAAESQL